MSKIIESLRVWITLKYSPRYPGKRWQHWIPSHYQWMRRRTDPGWQPLYWQRCLKEPEGERTKIRLSFMKTCCRFWGLNLTLISNVFKTKETDWNEKMFSDHWSALVFSHEVCGCSWLRHQQRFFRLIPSTSNLQTCIFTSTTLAFLHPFRFNKLKLDLIPAAVTDSDLLRSIIYMAESQASGPNQSFPDS